MDMSGVKTHAGSDTGDLWRAGSQLSGENTEIKIHMKIKIIPIGKNIDSEKNSLKNNNSPGLNPHSWQVGDEVLERDREARRQADLGPRGLDARAVQ